MKTRYVFGLILLILGLIITGCQEEPPQPLPTEDLSIVASGSFLVDNDSPLEITFVPEGGALFGEGTLDLDGDIYDVTISGNSKADGSAFGNLIMENSDLAQMWQWRWTATYSEGIFQGDFNMTDDDGEVLASYSFELKY
jgi:hypothetical protein